MDVVSGEEHKGESLISPRNGEYASWWGVKDYEGSLQLDAKPTDILKDSESTGTGRDRPICISPNNTAATILQLEARPTTSCNGCSATELGWFKNICQLTLKLDGQDPIKGPKRISGGNVTDSTSIANTTLVPKPSRSINRFLQGRTYW